MRNAKLLCLIILIFYTANLNAQKVRTIKSIVYKNGQTVRPVVSNISFFSKEEMKWTPVDGSLFVSDTEIDCGMVRSIKILPKYPGIYKSRELSCEEITEEIEVYSVKQFIAARQPSWSVGFDGQTFNNLLLTFEKDDQIDNAILKILRPIGFESIYNSGRFIVESAPIDIAQASIIDSRRYIFYNPQIVQNILDNDWRVIGVFAHELAHHLFIQNEGGPLDDGDLNINKELEADEWAGYILGYLNSTKEEAVSMLEYLQNSEDFPISLSERSSRITKGWDKAVENKLNSLINKKYVLYQSLAEELINKYEFDEQVGVEYMSDMKKAKRYLDTAISMNDYNSVLYFERAKVNSIFDLAGGVADARKAHDRDPNDVEIISLLALMSIRINQYQDAESFFDLLQGAKLKDPAMYDYVQGTIYFNKRNFAEAIQSFTKAIEKSPTKALNSRHYRGLSYAQTQEFEKALVDFTESIKIAPKYLNGYQEKANLESMLGRYDDAYATVTKGILRSDPINRPFLYHQRAFFRYNVWNQSRSQGWAAALSGEDKTELNNIIRDLERSLAINPSNLDAQFLKGQTLMALKEFREAFKIFNDLVIKNPIELNYLWRGMASSHIRRYGDAENDFNFYLNKFPNDLGTIEARAFMRAALKNYDKAIEDFNKLITLNSANTNARNGRARAFFNVAKYEQSLQDFLALDQLDGIGNVTFYDFGTGLTSYMKSVKYYLNFHIAQCYEYLNQNDNADNYYSKLIDLDDKDYESLILRGLFRKRISRMDLSKQDFQRALIVFQSLKEEEEYTFWEYQRLFEIYLALENYDLAERAIQRKFALEEDWAHPYTRSQIARVLIAQKRYKEALKNLSPNTVDKFNRDGHNYYSGIALINLGEVAKGCEHLRLIDFQGHPEFTDLDSARQNFCNN